MVTLDWLKRGNLDSTVCHGHYLYKGAVYIVWNYASFRSLEPNYWGEISISSLI